jgi:hypothetical protein
VRHKTPVPRSWTRRVKAAVFQILGRGYRRDGRLDRCATQHRRPSIATVHTTSTSRRGPSAADGIFRSSSGVALPDIDLGARRSEIADVVRLAFPTSLSGAVQPRPRCASLAAEQLPIEQIRSALSGFSRGEESLAHYTLMGHWTRKCDATGPRLGRPG